MEIVNQYLRAVAALLPRAQRDDITAELRDIILSRIEAREAQLGRPLGDDEIEAELRAVGHPILVAARYRQEPQHLVGPSLYPYWTFAVKIAITIQVAAALLALVLHIIGGQDFTYSLGQALRQTLTGVVTLVGIATMAAWAIERGKIHIGTLDHWRVRDLRVLEYAGWDFTDLYNHFRQARGPRTATARETRRKVRVHPYRSSPVSQGIFQVAFGTVFILWWVGVIPLTILAPATRLHRLGDSLVTTAGMNLGELHTMVFWPVLFYSAAIIGQGALNLVFPAAMRLRGLIAVLMGAALLAFCIWMWTASPIASAIRIDSLAELMLTLKQDLHSGLPVAPAPFLTMILGCLAFAALIRIVQGLWEMLILPRGGAKD